MPRGFSEGFLRPKKDTGKSKGIEIIPPPTLVENYRMSSSDSVKKGNKVTFDSTGKVTHAKRPFVSRNDGVASNGNTNSSGNRNSAKLKDTNKVVVGYQNSTSTNISVFCDEYDQPNATLTKGTEVVVHSGSAIHLGTVPLTDKFALTVFLASGVIRGHVIENTIGTILSVKATNALVSSGYNDGGTVVAISDTQVVLFWRDTSNILMGVVVTIDLTTFVATPGTQFVVDTSDSHTPDAIALDGNVIALGYVKSDGTTRTYKCRLLEVVGTNLTSLSNTLDLVTHTASNLISICKFDNDTITVHIITTNRRTYLIAREGNAVSLTSTTVWFDGVNPRVAISMENGIDQVTWGINGTIRVLTLIKPSFMFESPIWNTTLFNVSLAFIEKNTIYARHYSLNQVINGSVFRTAYEVMGIADHDANPNQFIRVLSL